MGQISSMDKEARTTNTGFASGGVTCKLGALCFYASSLLVDSSSSETRPNAKPATVNLSKNPLPLLITNQLIVNKLIYFILLNS